jgi:hypothetical protein
VDEILEEESKGREELQKPSRAALGVVEKYSYLLRSVFACCQLLR